ncbi:MAG: valine--tRNA ligase [Candidatus Latescibacteria bacterium]|nr:valine--tRNA ligase [bacterium]MBD3423679.1 valine--tRNA ligase [Candidatus Latescibacterota bacterium]
MLDKVFNPNDIERKWTDTWTENHSFTPQSPGDGESYCIILPPPNVTGMLTIGHVLGTTVQDILVRWKRLRGYNVLWLAGTDHAGIATQKRVEKNLLERGVDLEAVSREQFLEECWKWKEKYHGRIVSQLNRLGASLDWSREKFTLDETVSSAVREVFVRLYEKGLIYRGNYMVNWCPSCETAISDEEVEFREMDGKLYYIAYPFTEGNGELVVATTRPETMLGDTGVAVGPDDPSAPDLKGKKVRLPLTGRDIPVIFDQAVDPEFGTGCLKITPAHDPTDFEIGRRHNLDEVVVIDRRGIMNEEAGEFAGLDRYQARERVLEALREKDLLRKVEDYRHSVGHHDRCGTVIEPAVSRQWFMKMEKLAAPAIEVVRDQEVNFFPERWKNIYLNWMENIRDWCISRQLWWGHRIPVWYCDECGELIVSRKAPGSCPECGGEPVQDEDVLDTWFSSWLWTFSPMGWPEETDDLRTFHPTDVLVTGGDIIFFWVARMIMASLEFMDEVPFSSVYITGIVRDEKGRKMSKSLGNSPDPIDIIDRYGADALRFSLMKLSPPGQDILFDEKKVEVGRHFANKIWNASRLVLSKGVIGSVKEANERSEIPEGDITALFRALFSRDLPETAEYSWEDRWILSRLAFRMEEVDRFIEKYRFDEAVSAAYDFFWHEYCDWYLEFSKNRFSGGGAGARGCAVTARTVLGLSMVMLHPVMPFITEEIWNMLSYTDVTLAENTMKLSLDGFRDREIEDDLTVVIEAVTAIRNLKQTFNLPGSEGVRVIMNFKEDSELLSRLPAYRSQICEQAGIEELEITRGAGKPAKCVTSGHLDFEIYLPLDRIADVDGEIARIESKRDKLQSDLKKIEARLENRQFLEKAPEEVVARERERMEEMKVLARRMESTLRDLR